MKVRRSGNGLSFYGRDTHLSVFMPATSHGMYSEWGYHLKHRGRDRTWKHNVLRLFQKADPIPGGTGCWKCEWCSYRTRRAKGDGGSGNRLTIKRFIRLKVGYGGPKPTDPNCTATEPGGGDGELATGSDSDQRQSR